MMRSTHTRTFGAVPWIFCLGILLFSCPVARCADKSTETEEEKAVPLFLFNVGSVDRALSDVTYLFETIERPDMNELILNFIRETLGDLDGVDRSLPFGYAFFLRTETLPPQPVSVVYVPIENLKDAIQTISTAPATPKMVSGRKDLIEGIGAEGRIEYVIRILGKYAYITSDHTREILDTLPDLTDRMNTLASRYDASFELQINAVPEGVRRVFINFLRAQSEVELQRRDDEPESAYLARRATGVSTLDAIEEVLLQGEEFTIGWNGKPEERQGIVELSIKAKPGSDYAKHLRDLSGKPSLFTPLYDENRPLTISASVKLNKREKDFLSGMAQAAKVELAEALPEVADESGPLDQLYESVKATIDAGQFDGFLQVATTEPEKFSVIGGLRVVEGKSLGVALGEVLDQVALVALENEGTAEIRTRAETYQGVTLHRIQSLEEAPEQPRKVFGGQPSLHVGTSNRALWFVFGAEEAMNAFRSSIDRLMNATAEERNRRLGPLMVTFRVAPWLRMPEPRGVRRQRRREIANESFDETDALRIEARPNESGLRIKATISEGFFKMLGKSVATGYDRRQNSLREAQPTAPDRVP